MEDKLEAGLGLVTVPPWDPSEVQRLPRCQLICTSLRLPKSTKKCCPWKRGRREGCGFYQDRGPCWADSL